MMVTMRKMTMKRMTTKTRTRTTRTRPRSSTRTAKSTRSPRPGPGEAPEGPQESTPLTQPSLGAEVTGTISGLTTSRTTSTSS